jgi:hypothetical protein
MTLCTNCQSKIPSLRARKQAVNADLHKLGLTYHNVIPMCSIEMILNDHGFLADSQFHFSNYVDGRTERLHEEIGEGLWLTASFYRMESGRWEAVAYVNG